MRGLITGLLGTLGLVAMGCGAFGGEPETPTDEYGVPIEQREEEEEYDEVDQPAVSDNGGDDDYEEEEEEEKPPPPPEPKFTEGMSVAEARNAVPAGTDRVNIDDEVLGRPLRDPELYKPCKLGGQNFKTTVAVWDGRAVGIDVEAKNAQLAECIKEQVRNLKWRDKAKSLNTVEYSM